MITVQLDKLGYFTGSYAKIGSVENGTCVDSLPHDLSNNKTTCWRLDYVEYTVEEEVLKYVTEKVPTIDENTGEQAVDEFGEPLFNVYENVPKYVRESVIKIKKEWVFDETKYTEILAEIEKSKANQPKSNKELTEENKQLSDNIDDIIGVVVDIQFQLDIQNI